MAKKRGQREGTIYKRKDGSWMAQITIQGQRKTKYFKTQGEGLEWLRNMRNQIQNGLTLVGVQTTLKDFLGQWLIAHKPSVRPNMIEQYVQIINQHIVPVLGNIKLMDIHPDQIQGSVQYEN